jgi:hypothetical protein
MTQQQCSKNETSTAVHMLGAEGRIYATQTRAAATNIESPRKPVKKCVGNIVMFAFEKSRSLHNQGRSTCMRSERAQE